MIPPSFDYYSPRSLPEAVALLEKNGEDSKILSGGQSLIPIMKLRLGSPKAVIDIRKVQGLEYIRESDGFLRIGALTRVADLADSDLVRRKYPIIHDAASHIADPLVRNLGTVGGNIAHGDPANDLPAVMLALGAEFYAAGPAGGGTYRAENFFVDSFTTALQRSEILSEIRAPVASPRSGGAYMKLEKRVGDFAIAGVALQLSLDDKKNCARIGIGLTSVGPTALKAKKAEELLRGKRLPDEESVRRAAELASEAANPSSDLRGPSEYKKEMIKVLTVRTLKRAYERAVSGGA